jgi:hypothetical protein
VSHHEDEPDSQASEKCHSSGYGEHLLATNVQELHLVCPRWRWYALQRSNILVLAYLLHLIFHFDRLAHLKIRAGKKAASIVDSITAILCADHPCRFMISYDNSDIRFEIKKVQKTSDKIFLLVQVKNTPR